LGSIGAVEGGDDCRPEGVSVDGSADQLRGDETGAGAELSSRSGAIALAEEVVMCLLQLRSGGCGCSYGWLTS